MKLYAFSLVLQILAILPIMRASPVESSSNSTTVAPMRGSPEGRVPGEGERGCVACLQSAYDPVCGPDGFTYYSMCYYDCITGTISPECCRTPQCREYSGKLDRTRGGKICSLWSRHQNVYVVPNQLTGNKDPIVDENFPLDGSVSNALNYCRNPDNGQAGLWCYVGNREPYNFDLCDVPSCGPARPFRVSSGRQTLGRPSSGECTGRPTRQTQWSTTIRPLFLPVFDANTLAALQFQLEKNEEFATNKDPFRVIRSPEDLYHNEKYRDYLEKLYSLASYPVTSGGIERSDPTPSTPIISGQDGKERKSSFDDPPSSKRRIRRRG